MSKPSVFLDIDLGKVLPLRRGEGQDSVDVPVRGDLQPIDIYVVRYGQGDEAEVFTFHVAADDGVGGVRVSLT